MTNIKKGMSDQEIEAYVQELIKELSLEEKTYMMSGHGFLHQYLELDEGQWGARTYQAGGGNEKRGIPCLQFSDGPRGIVTKNSTCFPVSMARGATWDVELEMRIGEAIGKELRAHGGNLYGGVCINLLRHPAWGRAQETYGEDPYQLGAFGAALVRGVQKHNVIATVKHFAANSMENVRFKVNVKMDERTLREIYLPHFKRCVDEGVGSVMSAYNKVNGEYCGQNNYLLNEILKKEWGFEGFVHSDWLWGLYATYAASHGLDIENLEPVYFGEKLTKAVEDGFISLEVVNNAIMRILRTLFRFLTREDPRQTYDESLIACRAHTELAREAAEKGIVLLQNEGGILPFSKQKMKRIAVVGELASTENTGDHGSSWVNPPYVITPLEGLKKYLGDSVELSYNDGKDIKAVQQSAGYADAVILVVGYTYLNEGEYIPDASPEQGGGDRDILSLPDKDVELIKAVASINPHTAVIVTGGSAIIMEEWRDLVPAILMAWYTGMEGGTALARILFGEVNPSGKLPCVFPKSESHLPYFDKEADEITYDFYHGYTLLDRDNIEPGFPFGYGMSYTAFAYSNLRLDKTQMQIRDKLTVSVDVTNTGNKAGAEVVQLYVGYQGSSMERHVKDLKGFKRVSVQPGETKSVKFNLKSEDLAYYDVKKKSWMIEPITYKVYVGPSSYSEDLLMSYFQVGE